MKKTILLICLCFLLVLIIILYLLGIKINTSKSIPLGIYIKETKELEKGDYVLFCPPNNSLFQMAKNRGYITPGFCEGNLGYMMKKILAAKNDIVDIGIQGVFINKVLTSNSKPLNKDNILQPLPSLNLTNYKLMKDEYLLMSENSATSFDARYFGVIKKEQILNVLKPVLIFKSKLK